MVTRLRLPSASPAPSLQTAGVEVDVAEVTRRFGDVTALDGVSLTVRPGEFVTLLGASGSGKTTLLRIIAGFESLSSGSIRLNGREISRVPVRLRNIGMVFQNYALFPHMTVERNIAFPLARRGVPRALRAERVAEALSAVELTGFDHRMPSELSGGQQQRVALARAIVSRPSLVLMDEPLGALDKRLREVLQLEIRRLSHELGLTVINVTHDQEEALSISDRIALLHQGKIVQFGTPRELFASPVNETVAHFLGESNLFRGSVDRARGTLDLAGAHIEVSADHRGAAADPVVVMVRPHVVSVSRSADLAPSPGVSFVHGVFEEAVYVGYATKILLRDPSGIQRIARVNPADVDALARGDEIALWWPSTENIVLH